MIFFYFYKKQAEGPDLIDKISQKNVSTALSSLAHSTDLSNSREQDINETFLTDANLTTDEIKNESQVDLHKKSFAVVSPDCKKEKSKWKYAFKLLSTPKTMKRRANTNAILQTDVSETFTKYRAL
jgi:hypothetical protein